MKKLAVAVVLALVAVAFGPSAWRSVADWRAVRAARLRVEWMLRERISDDVQTALCQWARGRITMPMADMEEALPEFEAFWSEAELGTGRGWRVEGGTVVDEGSVELVLRRDDRTLRLLVPEDRAILLVE